MEPQDTVAASKPDEDKEKADPVEVMIGLSALISMAVAFVSILFNPTMSLAASAYTFTAITSITIMHKKP